MLILSQIINKRGYLKKMKVNFDNLYGEKETKNIIDLTKLNFQKQEEIQELQIQWRNFSFL